MLAAGAAHIDRLQCRAMNITTMNTAQAMGIAMAMTLALPDAGLGAQQ